MDILESNEYIAEQVIRQQVEDHFKNVLLQIKKPVETVVRQLIVETIKREPEYNSLLEGQLLGEFGLLSPNEKLSALLTAWSEEISVTIRGSSLMIEAIFADFNKVLSLNEARQVTEKGEYLDWLNWLLIQGDKTIIKEYHVKSYSGPASRTGLAIMVKKGKWSVPSQYAGTIRDNWITRAIDNIDEDKFTSLIVAEIQSRW